MSTQSPSKYTSLKRLEQIKRDHYVGANGIDYESDEVDRMIMIKSTRRGISMANSGIQQQDELEGERLGLLQRVAAIRLKLSLGVLDEYQARIEAQELTSDVRGICGVLGTWDVGFSLFRAAGAVFPIDLREVRL